MNSKGSSKNRERTRLSWKLRGCLEKLMIRTQAALSLTYSLTSWILTWSNLIKKIYNGWDSSPEPSQKWELATCRTASTSKLHSDLSTSISILKTLSPMTGSWGSIRDCRLKQPRQLHNLKCSTLRVTVPKLLQRCLRWLTVKKKRYKTRTLQLIKQEMLIWTIRFRVKLKKPAVMSLSRTTKGTSLQLSLNNQYISFLKRFLKILTITANRTLKICVTIQTLGSFANLKSAPTRCVQESWIST